MFWENPMIQLSTLCFLQVLKSSSVTFLERFQCCSYSFIAHDPQNIGFHQPGILSWVATKLITLPAKKTPSSILPRFICKILKSKPIRTKAHGQEDKRKVNPPNQRTSKIRERQQGSEESPSFRWECFLVFSEPWFGMKNEFADQLALLRNLSLCLQEVV